MANPSQVFMIDNTESMKTHRKEVRNTLEAMAYLAKSYDPDGMDIHFTMSRGKGSKIKTTEKLLQKFDSEQFSGTSDMQSQLATYLEEYKRKFSDQHRFSVTSAIKNVSLSKARQGPPPRLSLYIFTDGIWQPRSEVELPIKLMVEYLQENKMLNKQVGIQFVQFGDNKPAIQRLEYYDRGLKLDVWV